MAQRFPSLAPLLAVALLLVAAVSAAAQDFDMDKAEVRLVSDQTSYEPGSVARLAALVSIDSGWHVNSHEPLEDFQIPTELDVELPPGTAPPEVRYPEHELMTFSFAESAIAVYDGEFPIFVDLLIPQDAGDTLPVEVVLHYQACDDKSCMPPTEAYASFEIAVGEAGKSQHAAIFGTGGASAGELAVGGDRRSLFVVLLLALVGGLILNAMPCVLPVLSLKIFGLVKSAGHGRRELVGGALATTFGILVSFWALALAAILAARAGAAVGWGIQFQQPGFVTFLAVIVVLFSLNMWGLFEVPLPAGLAQLGSAGAREGLGGHFFSGLFATLMATPCSAPFLGTAIGFALAQPATIIFLVFTAIGLGLALPYLLLGLVPGLARFLPKPGAWMETFRQVMGFLLAAAAIWLFYVLAAQISAERLAFVQLALLGVALSVWAMRQADGRKLMRRLAAVAVVLTSFASVALAAGSPDDAPRRGQVEASDLIAWRAFDEAEAEALAHDGTPVFLDFTADWCLTCKANERAVIETRATAELFREHGVVAMKGDWTNRDDAITEYLARHGRAAVPFYVLYGPDGSRHVFGEVLTHGEIRRAVERLETMAGSS